jgi:hypothetical protein
MRNQCASRERRDHARANLNLKEPYYSPPHFGWSDFRKVKWTSDGESADRNPAHDPHANDK